MKPGVMAALVAGGVLVGAAAVYMVDIDQTQEASLPDVDVQVEGGNLPAYDVETGSIELTSDEATVTVPEVEVDTQQVEVTVPGISINPAEDTQTN
ncbi:hypothetical protein [Pseudaestuariivita rosea]|uniref:hypothetical protein n=1 Tax=Pseudaestuariivita rosea TaxID=2763263 RepID=UPI001ABA6037|nr:hypothetical protein [Pseudaestuariivita rosea]